MRVVIYDKVHDDGFREMGIWRGSIFGVAPSFREYAIAWMHGIAMGNPDSRYLEYRQPKSVAGANLFHSTQLSGFPQGDISKKYSVPVFGRCVEFKVVWLEEL